MKFYRFIWSLSLHLTAKWHLIIFKYDKVIVMLVWPPSDFCALKNVCTEAQQNSIDETTQWTICLTFNSHPVCLKRSPPAFTHLFRCLTVTLYDGNVHCQLLHISSVTMWSSLIGSCGRLPRSPATLLWVRWLTWVLEGACDRPPASHPDNGRHASPWSLDQANLEATDPFWCILGNWPEAIPARWASVVDSLPIMTADRRHN